MAPGPQPPLRVFSKTESVNLLALDGGGIKGISTLVILDKIMDRIKEIENDKTTSPRLPYEYFDLAGGTSTGGIIALMLFRLQMNTKDAIKAYLEMGNSIFPKLDWTTRVIKGTLFDADELLKAVDKVVGKFGPSADDKKNKGSSPLVDDKTRM
jgi:patatin-like phospholipase/acyl hydrolase